MFTIGSLELPNPVPGDSDKTFTNARNAQSRYGTPLRHDAWFAIHGKSYTFQLMKCDGSTSAVARSLKTLLETYDGTALNIVDHLGTAFSAYLVTPEPEIVSFRNYFEVTLDFEVAST